MQQLLLSCVLWCLYCQNVHRTHRWWPLYFFKLSQHNKKYLAWLWQNLNGLFHNKTAQFLHGLNKLNELCNLGRILFTRLFVSGKDWWRKQTCGFWLMSKRVSKRWLGSLHVLQQLLVLYCHFHSIDCRTQIHTWGLNKLVPAAASHSPLTPGLHIPVVGPTPRPQSQIFSPGWLWFDWWSAGRDELLPPALKTAKCLFLPPSLTRLTTWNN